MLTERWAVSVLQVFCFQLVNRGSQGRELEAIRLRTPDVVCVGRMRGLQKLKSWARIMASPENVRSFARQIIADRLRGFKTTIKQDTAILKKDDLSEAVRNAVLFRREEKKSLKRL